MLELSELSPCKLKTILNNTTEQNMISTYIESFIFAQPFLEEIIKFHDGVM